jgi:hypothetical protein
MSGHHQMPSANEWLGLLVQHEMGQDPVSNWCNEYHKKQFQPRDVLAQARLIGGGVIEHQPTAGSTP